MKKRQIFLILPFLYIVPLSLLNSGCGSANTLRGESSGAQAQGVAESTDESLITDSLGDSLAMASDAIDSTDSIPESIPAIDEFISQSKQALVLEDFETANDILRRACEELDADLLQSPELEQVVQQY